MNLRELKRILSENKIYPSKLRGQNFLIDNNVLDKIEKAADLDKKDNILEIGPGFGALTERLTNSGANVLAVELDKFLYNYLAEKFKNKKNLKIINKDILKLSETEIIKKLSNKYRIIANLPYSITGAVLRKFLESDSPPEQILVMIQKEVGERILAKPGQMNLLALCVQFYGQPKILFKVKKTSFYPVPKVDSVILQISQIGKNKIELDEKKFWGIVRAGFSLKRKKLIGNLVKAGIADKSKLEQIFSKIGVKESVRAQELSLRGWVELCKDVNSKTGF